MSPPSRGAGRGGTLTVVDDTSLVTTDEGPTGAAPAALTFTDEQREAAQRLSTVAAQLVPGLAAAMGPRTEVVLHDLTRLPSSIVAVAGDLTGRGLGDPATGLGLQIFRSGCPDDLVGYRSELEDGTTVRSSSLFLRDEHGTALCCLCVNTDVASLSLARDALAALTQVTELSELVDAGGETRPERFPRTVEELTSSILADALARSGVPVDLMRKSHKVAVVAELSRNGFFLMRESVDAAAKVLHVSRYSVYNYLNELGESAGPDQEGTAAAGT